MLLCAAGSNPVHRSECYLDYVAVPVGGNFPCHLTRRIAFGCRDYATGPSTDEKVGAAGEATGDVRLREVAVERDAFLHALSNCAEHSAVLRLVEETRNLQSIRTKLRALPSEVQKRRHGK